MKRMSLVLAMALAAMPLVQAQTPEQKPAPAAKPAAADAEAILMKMEHDATAALLKKDAAGFGRIFADDAVLTGPDGAVQTKAQLLADVKSGALVLESSEMSDMKVRVHGDAAVVTYATNDKGTYKGQDVSGRYRWTDVFVRRGGSWQIVASQGTPVQKPAK